MPLKLYDFKDRSTRLSVSGTCGMCFTSCTRRGRAFTESLFSSQSRQPIQTLDDARDAIQSLYVGNTYILTGSVDGHIRTYDLRMGELRADYLGHPVTSVLPTQDGSTALVTTLDSHVRLMDLQTGAMLNDFVSHRTEEYRCRSCFGHAEASVICGDEDGRIWAWDLVDVRSLRALLFDGVLTRF